MPQPAHTTFSTETKAGSTRTCNIKYMATLAVEFLFAAAHGQEKAAVEISAMLLQFAKSLSKRNGCSLAQEGKGLEHPTANGDPTCMRSAR